MKNNPKYHCECMIGMVSARESMWNSYKWANVQNQGVGYVKKDDWAICTSMLCVKAQVFKVFRNNLKASFCFTNLLTPVAIASFFKILWRIVLEC